MQKSSLYKTNRKKKASEDNIVIQMMPWLPAKLLTHEDKCQRRILFPVWTLENSSETCRALLIINRLLVNFD